MLRALIFSLPLSLVLSGCIDSSIRIVNSTPEATITSPVTGDSFIFGSSVTIRGAVFDANNSASELSVSWRLNENEICADSQIAGDGSAECNLSLDQPGQQRILLEVRDPDNATGSAFVDISVLYGEDPVVVLLEPLEDAIYDVETSIPFEAQVSDADGPISAINLSWESSAGDDLSALPVSAGADGIASASRPLSVGTHTITVTATDAFGLVGSSSVNIEVVSDPDNDDDGFPASEDCDDNDANAYPGAPDPFGDGIDQNCDEVDGVDLDGDGWLAPGQGVAAADEDCDDSDASIYPWAGDLAEDLVDSDCDGLDCDADQLNNAYFVVCAEAREWAVANTTCQSYGYDSLASVLSLTENNFLIQLSTMGTGSLWIGFSDRSSEGNWAWEDGSTAAYTNWASGEPNGGSGENCLEFIGTNPNFENPTLWNDAACDQSRWWACSKR
ncbi:MAG: hypothetical protein CMP23_14920 [Rickettsiales bacterium]|nr:hypothetical protein [Rickettsiales bacterium]